MKKIAFTLALLLLTGCGKTTEEKKFLDLVYESDDIKFSYSSEWEKKEDASDSSGSDAIFFEIGENKGISYFGTYEEGAKAQRTDEAIKKWEQIYFSSLDMYEELGRTDYDDTLFVEDSFVKNGQAYIKIASNETSDRELHFYADDYSGTFYFSEEYSDFVMQIVETIEIS